MPGIPHELMTFPTMHRDTSRLYILIGVGDGRKLTVMASVAIFSPKGKK